ncbi:hypothetical protein IJ818_07195 [bacterium]|nr:hypothetical protein [bacterium]
MQELNEHFNNAIDLAEQNFSHSNLIMFLKNGNVVERQYAALNLDKLISENEAKILLSNLVGVDGKIREAAALKIAELTADYPNYFFDEENFNTFVNATIDIDGNVCRFAILAACNLIKNEKFSSFYANAMLKIIINALDEISKFTFRDKKYKINKQIFKIYWCLEALTYFYNFADKENLFSILEKCAILSEYTIREKCAKILHLTPIGDDLSQLKNLLQNDENYYVRSIFE